MEATVSLIAKRANASKTLSEEGIVAEGDYLKLKEEYIQKSQSLASERAHQEQLAEAMVGIKKQLASLDAEAQRKALDDIREAQRQRQEIAQELSKASDLNARQVLYAPVVRQGAAVGGHHHRRRGPAGPDVDAHRTGRRQAGSRGLHPEQRHRFDTRGAEGRDQGQHLPVYQVRCHRCRNHGCQQGCRGPGESGHRRPRTPNPKTSSRS